MELAQYRYKPLNEDTCDDAFKTGLNLIDKTSLKDVLSCYTGANGSTFDKLNPPNTNTTPPSAHMREIRSAEFESVILDHFFMKLSVNNSWILKLCTKLKRDKHWDVRY